MIAAAPWLASLAVLLAAAGLHGTSSTAVVGRLVAVEPRERERNRRRWRIRRDRPASIEPQVPQLLDLLAAGSSAGLSAELALRSAADVLDGRLGDDLRAVFDRADVGDRWRMGLAGYAAASGSRDLRRTVITLERTERLGSSLEIAAVDLATSVRASRRAARLERARTAPVKMLFPLVFLILPAFLLLTVVPVLLATVRTIA